MNNIAKRKQTVLITGDEDHSVWPLITGLLNSRLIQKVDVCIETVLWLYNIERIYI